MDTVWRFDEAVAESFDDMLERSIPQYREMRRLTTEIAARHLSPGDTVVDLGCSLGAALVELSKRCPEARFIGVDNSWPMVERASERLPQATIYRADLERFYPTQEARVTFAILTLQFLSHDRRREVVRAAYEHTQPGGILLVVEKLTGQPPYFVEEYHELKRRNGYTSEEITRKSLSLEGVLVPQSIPENEAMLDAAGWEVAPFWQWLNFAGWVGKKPVSPGGGQAYGLA